MEMVSASLRYRKWKETHVCGTTAVRTDNNSCLLTCRDRAHMGEELGPGNDVLVA